MHNNCQIRGVLDQGDQDWEPLKRQGEARSAARRVQYTVEVKEEGSQRLTPSKNERRVGVRLYPRSIGARLQDLERAGRFADSKRPGIAPR